MTTIAQEPRPQQRTRNDRSRLEHADHHPPGGAPLPADAAADRDGDAADVPVLPDLPLHVRRRDPRRLDLLRRLPGARLHRHRRALLRHRRRRRHGRGPRARLRRPAALAADPAQLGARRTRDRRHRHPGARLGGHRRDRLRGRLPAPRQRPRRTRRVRARDRVRLRVRVAVRDHGPVRRQRARRRRAWG